MKRLVTSLLAISIFSLGSSAWSKSSQQILSEDFRLPSTTPGVEIFLRNKHLKKADSFNSSRTVLYVHGATQPSETVFDLKVGNESWATYIASRGYDVWYVDVRGYGGSTPPKDQSKPFATTKDAVDDVDAAIRHILERRKLPKLQLIGWSWGTLITGSYAAAHPERVTGLVLLAPPWLSTTPVKQPETGWQEWTTEDSLKRLQKGVPDGEAAKIFPAAWKSAWEDALLANQPAAKTHTPPRFRSPTGVVLDSALYLGASKPLYDPKQIKAPTLIIRGAWDELTPLSHSQALFALLQNAPVRHLIEIPRATHFIEVETGRDALFREVQRFLDSN
jgi:pimeloyl-ACP methyl ester carboxylesterase